MVPLEPGLLVRSDGIFPHGARGEISGSIRSVRRFDGHLVRSYELGHTVRTPTGPLDSSLDRAQTFVVTFVDPSLP